jgi:hypothetical protein
MNYLKKICANLLGCWWQTEAGGKGKIARGLVEKPTEVIRMVKELLKRLVIPETRTEWIFQGMAFYNIGVFLIVYAFGSMLNPF